jgi:hypothetical protein
MSERNSTINMATCLAEIEMLRASFENVYTRTMFRLKDGPDPQLTKDWQAYCIVVASDLHKWQDRFYAHCKRDL